MLFTVTSWICAVSALAAFLYKLPTALRCGGEPAPVALCVYFLGSSLSFLIDLEPCRSLISRALPYPSITTVLSQSAVIVLTAAQQVALVHWSRRPERARPDARRRVLVFGTSLVVLVALFFLMGPFQHFDSAQQAAAMHLLAPDYALYMVLYLCICVAGQIETLRLSLHFAKIAHRPWLRRGMRIMGAGAALVIMYCVVRFGSVVGIRLDFDMSAWHPVSWLAGDTGSLLQIVGWTVPTWGVHLSAARLWCVRYRSYLRLRPLWLALCTAVPAVALAPPASRLSGFLPPRDLTYCLYRRVIEIRDGQLALRPYATPDAGRQQAGSARSPADLDSPAGEALLLRAALRARAAGPLRHPSGTAFSHPPHDDFDEELARLTEVADAFVRMGRQEPEADPARTA